MQRVLACVDGAITAAIPVTIANGTAEIAMAEAEFSTNAALAFLALDMIW